MLLLVLFVLLHSAGLAWGPVRFVFVIAAPVHIYRQLRGAYGRGIRQPRTVASTDARAAGVASFRNR